MASYGFGHNNKGWNEYKKAILANALRELVDDMEVEVKFIGLARQKPYVQVDEPYLGVNIKNVSYFADSDLLHIHPYCYSRTVAFGAIPNRMNNVCPVLFNWISEDPIKCF